jgi:hypothetical protein
MVQAVRFGGNALNLVCQAERRVGERLIYRGEENLV